MLRDKNFYLRIFAMLLLAGGIFASLIAGNVHATPLKNPPRQITGPHLTLVKTATTNYSTPPWQVTRSITRCLPPMTAMFP